MIKTLVAGMRFQAALMRRSPADLMFLLTTPLFAVVFAAIMEQAGRPDLTPYAVLGTTVISLWSVALNVSGDVIDSDRGNGTLEAATAAPASLAVLVSGRVATVTLFSLIPLAESIAAVRVAFRTSLPVPHAAAFIVMLLVTAAAMAATATAMSSVFVIARSARTFQNALSYPFYILSGAIVPTSLLPGWLQPLTRIVFLSWSAGLMRDALRRAPIPDFLPRLAIIAALGAAAYGAGLLLMASMLRRMRETGTAGYI